MKKLQRHSSLKSIKITKEASDKYEKELEEKEEEREKILVRVQDARSKGDLSENGAYKYAKFELRNTDRRLRYLRKMLFFGEVTEARSDGVVGFGSKVVVENNGKQMEFMLVGSQESDPMKKKLSDKSPIGKKVLGKKVGDEFELETAGGEMSYKILKVE